MTMVQSQNHRREWKIASFTEKLSLVIGQSVHIYDFDLDDKESLSNHFTPGFEIFSELRRVGSGGSGDEDMMRFHLVLLLQSQSRFRGQNRSQGMPKKGHTTRRQPVMPEDR